MIIEINKDIEKYQESIAMGLTVKQLFFCMASLLLGGSIVLLTYQSVGLTISCYIAAPIVAPVAMGGFYQYNGMSFYEMMGRYFKSIFLSKALLYIATEYKDEMEEQKIAFMMEQRNKHKNKIKKLKQNKSMEGGKL